jgi:hypothetical protein
MSHPLDAEAVAYLLTLERAVPIVISMREALQRAFEAGRMKGCGEGIGMAQEIIARKEPS